MEKTAVQLREERAGLIAKARKLMEDAKKREGGPTAEDRAEFQRHMDAADKAKQDYEDLERLEAAERSLDTAESRVSNPIVATRGADKGKAQPRTLAEYKASPEYRSVFADFLVTGRVAYERVPQEFRDTILGTDAKGGYLSTPVQLASEFVKQVDDLVFIRGLAKVLKLTDAKALGVPQLGTRMADANWTTEVASVTEDTTMAFARRDLSPNLVSKLAKVSDRALYGATNIEQIVMDELVYKNAITEEKAFLTGDGSGKPLGIFTASASGVPTARDVSAGNSSTAIGADNIVAMKYALKAGYRSDPSTRWIWSRAAIQAIMTLTDSEDRYLWQPSIVAGQPDRLLNIPVAESEYVPATFTTGLYVGALGAFRYYWIAEVADLRIQRLVEKYADTNEIGFISRRYVDGSPVLGEAFVRSKLA